MTSVLVTGLGAITPIGNDVLQYWQNLLAGHSGAVRLTAFDVGDMPYAIGCEVKDFEATRYMEPGLAAILPRDAQFGIAAARQALADAHYAIDAQNCERVGVVMGVGGGGERVMEELATQMGHEGWKSVGPHDMIGLLSGTISASVSVALGAHGHAAK